jgi:hypothetical protein
VQQKAHSPVIEKKSIKDLQSMYNSQSVSTTDLLINREVEFLEDQTETINPIKKAATFNQKELD